MSIGNCKPLTKILRHIYISKPIIKNHNFTGLVMYKFFFFSHLAQTYESYFTNYLVHLATDLPLSMFLCVNVAFLSRNVELYNIRFISRY
jgi:hypothetical protein